MLRALTMLNERGDVTIVWTQDRDADMERVIEKKMSEGCIFYLINPRFGTREKLRDASDANQHRMLAIPDEDFAKFVGGPVDPAAGAEAHNTAIVRTPDAPVKGARRAKTAKEVATGESIGTKPRQGG